MRYEVRDGDSRFELDREEPLKEGDTFTQFTMIYRVRRILPGNDEFDASSKSNMLAGPGQSGH